MSQYYILPTNQGEIRHSVMNPEAYVVLPTNNELYHGVGGSHKYIDRVMGKNGKWRYIYNKAVAKTKRGVQAAKYAIRNERAAQENLRIEKDKARVRNILANEYENRATREKIDAENKRRIQGAKDKTALGRLKKNAPNAIKKKINKGLDWLEHNKIFSSYTESTTRIDGKVVNKTRKKNRLKVNDPTRR